MIYRKVFEDSGRSKNDNGLKLLKKNNEYVTNGLETNCVPQWLSRLACSFLCSTQSNLFRPNSAESASFRQIPTQSGELKSILANSSECAQFSRIQPNPIYFGRIPLHFADWNPIQINFSEHGRINPLQLKVSPNLPNTGEGPEV